MLDARCSMLDVVVHQTLSTEIEASTVCNHLVQRERMVDNDKMMKKT